MLCERGVMQRLAAHALRMSPRLAEAPSGAGMTCPQAKQGGRKVVAVLSSGEVRLNLFFFGFRENQDSIDVSAATFLGLSEPVFMNWFLAIQASSGSVSADAKDLGKPLAQTDVMQPAYRPSKAALNRRATPDSTLFELTMKLNLIMLLQKKGFQKYPFQGSDSA